MNSSEFDFAAFLYGTDILAVDGLTSEDGVHTPADGAGQGVVENDVDVAHARLWV